MLTDVPVSVTWGGVTVAWLYAIVRVRLTVLGGVPPGVKTTLIVHEAPCARVATQVPPAAPAGRENRCGVPPPNVKFPPASPMPPVLVTVKVRVLVVPVAQLPNGSR